MHKSAWYVLVGLCLILGLAPLLYFGGAFTWFSAVGLIATYSLIAWCVSWCLLQRRHHLRILPNLSYSLPMFFFIIPMAVGVCQLVPICYFTSFLSPQAASAWESLMPDALSCISVAPHETFRTIFWLLTAWIVYTICAGFGRHHRGIRIIAIAIVVAALGNVIIGLCHALNPPKEPDVSSPMSLTLGICNGVFQNRNHFGFFVNIGIFTLLGLLFGWDARRQKEEKKEAQSGHHHIDAKKFLAAFSPSQVPFEVILAMISLFLMIVGLFASLSRGAATSCLAGGGIFAIAWIVQRVRNGMKSHPALIAIGLMVFGALFFALPALLCKLSNRFDQLFSSGISDDSRAEVWRCTWDLIGHYWFSGVGLGAYGDVIQRFSSPTLGDCMIVHAHNDWLEAIAELGFPVTLVLMGIFGFFMYRSIRRLYKQRDVFFFWCGMGAWVALIAVSIHECFDFNLLAGPNLMSMAAILGCLQACSTVGGACQEESERVRWLSWSTPSLRYGAIIFLIMLFGLQFMYLRGNWQHDKLWTITQPGYHPKGQGAPAVSTLLKQAEKTWRILPNNPGVNLTYAKILYRGAVDRNEKFTEIERRQMLNRARIYLQRAGKKAPMNSQILLWQATVSERLSHFELALRYYENAVKCSPTILAYQQMYAKACMRDYHRRLYSHDLNERLEQSRMRALMAYCDVLKLAPKRINDIIPLLVELCNSPSDVLAYCPLTPETMPTLFENLLRQRDSKAADELLTRYSEQNDLEKNLKFLPEYAGARMLLARITGKGNLEKLWNDWVIAEQKGALAKYEAFVEDSKKSNGGNLSIPKLTKLNEDSQLNNFDALLSLAEIFVNSGRSGEMVATLVPLVWSNVVSPTQEQLQRAIKIVETPRSIPSRMEDRYVFLKNALPILAMDKSNGGKIKQNTAKRCRKNLQDLLDKVEKTNVFHWYQLHLASFYCAKASEMLGEHEKAVEYCHKCLRTCPSHLETLRILERLEPGYLTIEQRELLEIGGKIPIAVLGRGMLLRGLKIEKPTPMTMSSSVNVEMVFQCMGYMAGGGRFVLTLEDSHGAFTQRSIDFASVGNEPMRWLDGEAFIARCTFEMPVVHQINLHGIPRSADKKIFLRVQAVSANGAQWASMPPALLSAYVVETTK